MTWRGNVRRVPSNLGGATIDRARRELMAPVDGYRRDRPGGMSREPAPVRGRLVPLVPLTLNGPVAMPHSERLNIPGDVLDAVGRLAHVAILTPLLHSPELDERLGGRVLLKAENLQRTGAFKFRGAYNCLSRLQAGRYPGGVVAYSTGNHGQAVATVARMLGIRATIVMPGDAPAVKVAKARRQGARIVLYDRATQSRETISADIAREERSVIVPPGDDTYVIAGQGTVVLEALDQARDTVDAILVPCGGGGLTAGACLAADARRSSAEIWPVEPEGFDDTRRSLQAGRRVENDAGAGSACDSLLARTPAELPFAINRKRVAGALAVSDEDVFSAMRLAFEEFRVVLEPGGAVALAAALSDPTRLRSRTTIVIASGGNVDAEVFARAVVVGDGLAAGQLETLC